MMYTCLLKATSSLVNCSFFTMFLYILNCSVHYPSAPSSDFHSTFYVEKQTPNQRVPLILEDNDHSLAQTCGVIFSIL